MKSIALVQTDNREVNQLQQNIQQGLRSLLQNPLVDGAFLNGVVLESGDNTIEHRLSRVLQGYVVTLKSANEDIYDKQSSNTTPSTTLILNSSGDVTVNLYVF